MTFTENDRRHMARALELARRGEGRVEPNPMVGCVIASADGDILAEGRHEKFGGPHAEVVALAQAGDRARGATLYVTLEPCRHFGKTPPCDRAIVEAGIQRVVYALNDPFQKGARSQVESTGVVVQQGLMEDEARELCAPYLKLTIAGHPWIIAKWAMTLDGKIATRSGDSRWISGEASRAIAHQLRGRVDAIVVGRGTAERDDPLLTARPPGVRAATRIVVDSRASLSTDSRLVRSAADAPMIVAASDAAPQADCDRLQVAGVEVVRVEVARGPVAEVATHEARWLGLMAELGRRRMTNVLIEGGSRLLGSLFDARQIDEVHVFIAPILVGGISAMSPMAGEGVDRLIEAAKLRTLRAERLDEDFYIVARAARQDL